VESFIQGQHWLPQLDAPFILELQPQERSGKIQREVWP
jgi:pectinesterase